MEIIKPSFEILDKVDGIQMLKNLEKYGRTCYKSENCITEDSYKSFINMIVNEVKHESVIEHEKVTVKIICDRGVSHEIVRHRIASYSQESTRYCNYSKDKFGNSIKFIDIVPFLKSKESGELWGATMAFLEMTYFRLLELGESPQIARSLLPNSLKTEIIVTYNLREWKHFFKMRTSPKAHPQMREIAIPLLEEFKKLIPIIFDEV